MKIGILVAGHVADELVQKTGEFDFMFQRLLAGNGYEFEAWFVVDGQFPDSPDEADGWLITGSKHGAYEDLPWIPRLETFIRDIRAADRPLVGICFGHQIIAQALGGTVKKSDKGWAVGHQTYFYGDTPIGANAWHQDQVVALPEGADVIAGNDFCEYAALSYGDRILTMQPHPEFTDEFVEGMLRERAPGVVPDDLIELALANKDAVVATKTMIDMITNTFAKATEI